VARVANGTFEAQNGIQYGQLVSTTTTHPYFPSWSSTAYTNTTLPLPRVNLLKSNTVGWNNLYGDRTLVALQGQGAAIYQVIDSLVVGRSYRLTFLYISRPGYPTPILHVLLDAVKILDIAVPADTAMHPATLALVPTATTQTLTFRNGTPGDTTVFLAAVSLDDRVPPLPVPS
jgi:hypothetical protein